MKTFTKSNCIGRVPEYMVEAGGVSRALTRMGGKKMFDVVFEPSSGIWHAFRSSEELCLRREVLPEVGRAVESNLLIAHL